MKCLMPLNQRKVIAEAINDRPVVEWGGGGTTGWLLENSECGPYTTIEHNTQWCCKLLQSYADNIIWSMAYAYCDPGKNATIGEESADNWHSYVWAGCDVLQGSGSDGVAIIDGVVRGRCLTELVYSGFNGTIFIHDTQRDWYDEAIAEAVAAGFERTDYPEGDDYPGCLLTKLEKK